MASLSPVSAATTIQKAWRSHFKRCLNKAEYYIDTPALLETMESSPYGKSAVYFPRNLPQFILKNPFLCGPSRGIKTALARILITSAQLKHLVIPAVWKSYNGFLIEQRLPIKASVFDQMEIYLKHREEFSPAIAELAEFFIRAPLTDLRGNEKFPLGAIAGIFPRHDNLPLYISHGRYLVGLIDLEHISIDRSFNGVLSSEEIFDRLRDLVLFFPHYLDLIFSVAKKYCKEICETPFIRIQQDGLELLRVVYEDYLAFLKTKGITCENPDQPLSLSEERKSQILELMSQKLEERFEKDPFAVRVRQAGRFSEKLQLFKSALPQVLEAILDYLKKDPPKNKLTTDAELLAHRPLSLRLELLDDVRKCLKKSLEPGNFSWEEAREAYEVLCDEEGEPDFLVRAVFEELVKGGEVYYFDPCEASRAHFRMLLLY